MKEIGWNPWHGCHKFSAGCLNCYVYRSDARYERDASLVRRTASFALPVKRARGGEYKIPPGAIVDTCFTSDFFLEDADPWRAEAWAMMRERSDCTFFFITKRIRRFYECIPADWGDGYPNVRIGCTCENQETADERLPIFRDAPIAGKHIVCAPLLTKMDISAYLGPWTDGVDAGGESGLEARPCDFSWIVSLRDQCVAAGVHFNFRQTGANFIKDGRAYSIPRKFQFSQARKANMSFTPAR